jgi:hypothetical protein
MFGSAYGVFLAGEPLHGWASVSVFPDTWPPVGSDDMRENFDLRITDDRGKLIAPVRPFLAPPWNVSSERPYGEVRLSDWGYDLGLGRYRITYLPKPRITDWAAAHGYVVAVVPTDVRIVRRYSDVDPHYFPVPSGWDGSCPSSFVATTGRPTHIVMERTKQVPAGEECFRVYIFEAGWGGLPWVRGWASGKDVVALSDTTVTCGSERATVITFRTKTTPSTHTEMVYMELRSGFIFARYSRPDTVPDDPAALEALNAPCQVL